MLRAVSTLRVIVALVTCFVSGMSAASAETFSPNAAGYAVLLRSINPHLQLHESMAFARTVVADAQRSKLDPRLIVALVTVESHWRPNATSRVGAQGLGQLMPETAATLRVNAWDPVQNIRGAATYLRAMLNHFAGRGHNTMRYAIGAYNAGPKAVERYHGVPPYAETQNYVRKVLAVWRTINGRVGRAFAGPEPADDVATKPDAMWLAHAGASALAVTAPAVAAGAAVPPASAAQPALPADTDQTNVTAPAAAP